jgi:hypothetical protein
MSFVRKIKKGNKVYLAEVENVRINGKTIQKHIRYVGKEVNNQPILTGSVATATVERHHLWPLLMLDEIVHQIDLSRLLGEYGDYLLFSLCPLCGSDSLTGLSSGTEERDCSLLSYPTSAMPNYEAIDSVEGQSEIRSRIYERLQKVLKLSPEVILRYHGRLSLWTMLSSGQAGHNAEEKERQFRWA